MIHKELILEDLVLKVSATGEVFYGEELLKTTDNGNGYLYIRKMIKRKNYRFYVHRLVAMAFCENPNNYRYVDHKNKNKVDNRFDNLRWVSHQQNCETRNYSNVKKPTFQYPESTVNEVLALYKKGTGVMELARSFNIKRQTISSWIVRYT